MRQTAARTPLWLTESRTASRYCVSDKSDKPPLALSPCINRLTCFCLQPPPHPFHQRRLFRQRSSLTGCPPLVVFLLAGGDVSFDLALRLFAGFQMRQILLRTIAGIRQNRLRKLARLLFDGCHHRLYLLFVVRRFRRSEEHTSELQSLRH